MTVFERERKELWTGSLLERQALAYHYHHCAQLGEAQFPPDLVTKVNLRDDMGAVYMASTGVRHVALYLYERESGGRIGYRFRRLAHDHDDRQVSRALGKCAPTDLEGLAQLGLSRREIARVSGVNVELVATLLSHV